MQWLFSFEVKLLQLVFKSLSSFQTSDMCVQWHCSVRLVAHSHDGHMCAASFHMLHVTEVSQCRAYSDGRAQHDV
jgi:hypothetical protein